MASGWVQIPAYGSPSWKDSVASVAALPASGNSVGDARITLSTFAIYVWTGSTWQQASGGGGGIASINGDTTSAQVIAGGSGITVGTSSGTTTITSQGLWTPRLLNPYFWADASDFTASGSITAWREKSANGQLGTGTGTVVLNSQNGKPGVSLNGTSDKFTFGNTINTCPSNSPWTALIVANCSGFSLSNYCGLLTARDYAGSNSNQGFLFGFGNAAGGDNDFYFGDGNNNTSGKFPLTNSAPTGTCHGVTITYTGAQLALTDFTAFDSSIQETITSNSGTSGAASNAPTIIGVHQFGGGLFYYGLIYEILIVPGILSGPDLTNYYNYRLNKWGI